jgi:hypothetical protein
VVVGSVTNSSVTSGRVIRRGQKRSLGMFLDGVGLDRAAKRIGRAIDWTALVRLLSEGLTPKVLRYYTILPHEDDARHHAFLLAVENAGFETVVKRLPPKGTVKVVSSDVEIATDIMAHCLVLAAGSASPAPTTTSTAPTRETPHLVLICPNRELLYPMRLLHNQGISITVADFMNVGHSDHVNASSKWINLTEASIYRR